MKHPGCSCPASGAFAGGRPPAGPFLMQRILASGNLHLRCHPYPLPFDAPCGARPPFTLLSVAEKGAPCFEEKPCCEQGCILLCVTLPLEVCLLDSGGRRFTAASQVREEIRLRQTCPPAEAWRGTFFVQGAARLCRAGCACGKNVPLDLCIEAYLVSPCAVGAPCPPPCPPQKPWYPQPRFDPWQ